jgi:N-acetyl-alpha-D-glucosaminyl L-malate synthase BshA
MKIGITCHPTYGGSGVVGTELGKELASCGHDVHFISYSPPIRLKMADRIRFHEVEVLSYPLFEYPPYDLALASKMAEVARKENLDLLHVHYAIPHSISALLARMMLRERSVPFMTTLHGTDITLVGSDRSYLPITRLGIEESDAVTAVSDYLKRQTISEFGIQRPIERVYNFVNCDVFRKAADPEFRGQWAAPGEGILVHISNFRPLKRTGDVVEVFSRIRKRIPARLLMVGDGPDRPSAEWRAEVHGVQDDVRFLGKRADMERLLSVSDLLLLPSELESFGLVALEAMASEVPVIATRVGGVPEVVEDGEDGYLFEVGDVEGMAEAGLSLLSNPAHRAEMGRSGRAHAGRDFCHQKIVARYIELYEQMLGTT